jgi:CRISPR/Cas system endoribonuclease Cas6 (RAMP superfamily)
VHPGESEAYRRKIQRREEREFERNLLNKAKIRHRELYGENTPINRVKIRKFKRELRREMTG